jgi:hypothetical protein
MAKLAGEAPAYLVLDVPAISAKLAHQRGPGRPDVNDPRQISVPISWGVNANGLKPAKPISREPLDLSWTELVVKLPKARHARNPWCMFPPGWYRQGR